MPKIDYNELFSVQQLVQQARLAILDQFSPFNSTIQEFSGENELTGDSWDSAKSYLTQIPPVSTGVFNALSEVGETLGNYLSSFQAEVGSPKNQLDTDKLQDLNTRLKSLNAQKEACLEAMRKSAKLVTYGPGETIFGTSYVDMGNTGYENAIEDVEKDIEILEKYETFESNHGSDFSTVENALTQLKTGLAELKRDVSFDSSTGNFSKLSLKDKEWYQAVEEYNKDQPAERFEMVKTYKEKFREDGTLIGYEVVYNVYVNGVLNVDRTNKMTEVMREAQWGEMSTFVLEVTGVNDFRRYFSGFDPITGEKLTGNQQALSGLIGLMSAISTYEAAKMLVNLQKGYAMMQGVDIADDLVKLKPVGPEKASRDGGFDINEIRPKLKTDPDTAFFWSGRTDGVGGADIAASVAKGKGGTTLETTIANKNIKMPEWDFNNPNSMKAWDLASGAYAEQVSGQVRAVVGSELRLGNIWENVELPRLKSNPKVTKITTIDPKTGIEKIIFERK